MSAIDARGLEQFECIRLDQPGIYTQCRPCVPTKQNYDLAFLPVTAAVATWRPVLSAKPGPTPEPVIG